MHAAALASSRSDGSAAIAQPSCGSSTAAAHSAHRPDGDPWSPKFRRLVEACEALGAAEDLAVLERAIETFGVDRLGRVRLELPVAPSPRARLLLRELCDVVLARHGALVVRWAEGPTGGIPEAREYNPLCSVHEGAADGRPRRVARLAPNREQRQADSRPVISGPPKDCQALT
ncbi:MAG: hypothetical protein F9K18_04545 [Thermoanaerobaculia bacterium]|nr:MAG: hypothetical protein F9K18_04545 [Thermoanaerobaculia bacterium]